MLGRPRPLLIDNVNEMAVFETAPNRQAAPLMVNKSVSVTQSISTTKELTANSSLSTGLNALYPDGHVSNCNDQEVFRDPVWNGVGGGVGLP